MSSDPKPPVRKGNQVELDIDSFGDKGKSIGRIDDYVILVKGAVPGDRVRARIQKCKTSYAEADLLDVIQPSSRRTTPRCVYVDSCGGCTWQHVKYEEQLQMKQDSVVDALVHTGGFSDDNIRANPILGADSPYFYRNKMEFTFSARRWLTRWEIDTGQPFDTDFALGMHVPGHYDKVLDLNECYLQSPLASRIINEIRDFCRNQDWSAWNVHTTSGFLRHLVIRMSTYTDDVFVNLVTHRYEPERMETFASFLRDKLPSITTFVNTINTGVAKTSEGDITHTIFGPGVLYDKIGPYRFEIGPHTFFQTNTRQAERLYQVAQEFADLDEDETLYDLYCGVGTLGVFLSENAENVVGIELDENAAKRARRNAELNEVSNCSFYSGAVKESLPGAVENHGRPDVLICDPPRPGIHKHALEQIIDMAPSRMVYVSCNPQTQARDLGILRDHFLLEQIQPVDLFPHTPHIENVAQLTHKS